MCVKMKTRSLDKSWNPRINERKTTYRDLYSKKKNKQTNKKNNDKKKH